MACTASVPAKRDSSADGCGREGGCVMGYILGRRGQRWKERWRGEMAGHGILVFGYGLVWMWQIIVWM